MRNKILVAVLMCLVLVGCGDAPTSSKSDVDIIASLKAQGIPIGEVATYTAETDPNELLGRPNGYTHKSNWLDTRIERETKEDVAVSDGGGIEIYPDNVGAQTRMDKLQAIGASMSQLIEYNYVHGNVLLRVAKRLTPDQAVEYDKAVVEALK